MPEREVKIINKLGIHARPAAEIVKTAGKFKCDITIVRDDLEVNAKSIMGVMMLAAENGATIALRAIAQDWDCGRLAFSTHDRPPFEAEVLGIVGRRSGLAQARVAVGSCSAVARRLPELEKALLVSSEQVHTAAGSHPHLQAPAA